MRDTDNAWCRRAVLLQRPGLTGTGIKQILAEPGPRTPRCTTTSREGSYGTSWARLGIA